MDLQKSFTKVFAWMFLGLLLTFGTGYTVANNLQLLEMVYTKSTMFILIIIEVGLAIFLSARVHKMNPTLAKIIYVLYTILSGLTFSSIFITYKFINNIYIWNNSRNLWVIRTIRICYKNGFNKNWNIPIYGINNNHSKPNNKYICKKSNI